MSGRTISSRRYATILAKIGSKPRVMENGIKSPSLSCGTGAVARDRGLKQTRSPPEHSAASFRNGSEDALSASAIPEGNGVLPYVIPSLPEQQQVKHVFNVIEFCFIVFPLFPDSVLHT